jgi:hypothetical protein
MSNRVTKSGNVGSSGGGGGGTWYVQKVTLAGDNQTFTLSHAPQSVIFIYSNNQPQIYGTDYTGTINGTNTTFVYTNPVDPSLLSYQYATYQ